MTPDETVKYSCLVDLLDQANEILRDKSCYFQKFDLMFTGEVRTEGGERVEVRIEQNETGKYIIKQQ